MNRYMLFVWFNVRILTTALFWTIPLLYGLLYLPFDRSISIGILLAVDRGVATWIFHTRDRTISGICGGRAKGNRKGYVLMAKMIDRLAELCGDEPDHCYRAYCYEAKKFDILKRYM